MSGKRDPDATQRIERHRGQALRALCGGVSWHEERIMREPNQINGAGGKA